MNTYTTSTGERLTKSAIDRKIRQAKALKIKQQKDRYGFNFCQRTNISRGQYLDCSHIISVKECQESGRTELAWDLDNIEILTRSEHVKVEQWSKVEREAWYLQRKAWASQES